MVDTDSPNFEIRLPMSVQKIMTRLMRAQQNCIKASEGANVVIATGQQGDDNHEKRSSGYKDAWKMQGAMCWICSIVIIQRT